MSKQDNVAEIRERLSSVLSSLQKYQNPKHDNSSQFIKESLLTTKGKISELIEETLLPIHEDFSDNLKKTLQNFNSDLESTIESLQVDSKSFKDIEEPNSPVLIEKVHTKRSAPISKLLYNKDFRTIYNIFLAILVNFGVAELARDILDSNDVLGVNLFTTNFGQPRLTIEIWLGMWLWSYSTLIIVQFYNQPFAFLISLHLSSIFILGFNVVSVVNEEKVPIASSFIIMCEMVRFSLKMHSYFREKLLHGNGGNAYSNFIPSGYNKSQLVLPKISILPIPQEFNRYTYYLFAPTLIYRDTYPKIDRSIRWKNLSVHLFNFLGSIIYTGVIFKAFCVPEFQSASKNITNYQAVILSWFRSMLPGTMVFLLIFFSVMHSWFSVWAEILNFADRKFYDDWWNSKNFSSFYRKLSVNVYEWLHGYVYIDLQRFTKGWIGPRLAKNLVYVVSAVIIELILSISLGFFFPYMSLIVISSGWSMISFDVKASRFYNILVWVFLIMMMGLINMIYSIEYYYRIDRPVCRDFENYGMLAYLIPQWLSN